MSGGRDGRIVGGQILDVQECLPTEVRSTEKGHVSKEAEIKKKLREGEGRGGKLNTWAVTSVTCIVKINWHDIRLFSQRPSRNPVCLLLRECLEGCSAATAVLQS